VLCFLVDCLLAGGQAIDWLLANRQSAKKYSTYHLLCVYEGWSFNSGNYLFTTDTK